MRPKRNRKKSEFFRGQSNCTINYVIITSLCSIALLFRCFMVNLIFFLFRFYLFFASSRSIVLTPNLHRNVLTPIEVTTKKNDVKDQKIEEEEPFESSDMKSVEVKNGTFHNVSDCLYFFQRGGAVTLRSLAKNRTEQVHHLTFGHKPIKEKGKCFRNSTFHETFISLRFNLMNDAKAAGELKINATFYKNRRGYWEMLEMWAKLYKPDRGAFKFDCKHLETPVKVGV